MKTANKCVNTVRVAHSTRNPLRALLACYAWRSGDASRHPNDPAARARGSGHEARPEPAAAPDSRCTTSGCSAPAGEPRGRYVVSSGHEHSQVCLSMLRTTGLRCRSYWCRR